MRASYDAGSMALSMVFSNPIDASKVVVDASSTAQVDPSKTPTVAGNTVIVYLLNPLRTATRLFSTTPWKPLTAIPLAQPLLPRLRWMEPVLSQV